MVFHTISLVKAFFGEISCSNLFETHTISFVANPTMWHSLIVTTINNINDIALCKA